MNESEIARAGVCPHCSGLDLDLGATGLDLCRSCGGLSRAGAPLRPDTDEAPT